MTKKGILFTAVALGFLATSELCAQNTFNNTNQKKEVTMTRKVKNANKLIEDGVVAGYKLVEKGVVSGYKKIEEGVVSSYKKVEDKYVDTFLRKEDETIE